MLPKVKSVATPKMGVQKPVSVFHARIQAAPVATVPWTTDPEQTLPQGSAGDLETTTRMRTMKTPWIDGGRPTHLPVAPKAVSVYFLA